MESKQVAINRRGLKANEKELRGKTVKLGPWCLFKAINGFMKKAHMIRMSSINIA